MASTRKIDAAIFEQRWLEKLVEAGESQYVLLFLYLIITCRNPVGLFEVSARTWNFKLNPPVPFKDDDVFVKFGKRIRRVEGHPDKGIIVGFCDFQRNFGTNSRQWEWVVKDLASVGLTYEDLQHLDEEQQQEFDLGEPPPVRRRKADAGEPVIAQRLVIPPDIEWVRQYCSTRNNGIDAQRFMDFYSSKGWKIGKERMKDWQAAVRTWEGRRKDDAQVQSAPKTPVKQVIGQMRRKF